MGIYWVLWGFVFLNSILKNKLFNHISLLVFTLVMIFVVGFRYEVGADWGNYEIMFSFFQYEGLVNSLFITEPGYALINYIAQQLGFSVIFVNFICAIIFYLSFYSLSKNMPEVWLPYLVLFSYTIAVVSFGYTRQSIAIALVLAGMSKVVVSNDRRRPALFFLLACLFHKTAIIMFIFLPLIGKRNVTKFFTYAYSFLITIVILVYLYLVSLTDNIYTSGEVSSSGAVIRIAMHILAIAIYYIHYSRFKAVFKKSIVLFDVLAILILVFFVLSFAYSTIADRLNLYLVIFDVFVLCYYAQMLDLKNRNALVIVIFVMHSASYYIWQSFGTWAQAFEYHNYVTEYWFRYLF